MSSNLKPYCFTSTCCMLFTSLMQPCSSARVVAIVEANQQRLLPSDNVSRRSQDLELGIPVAARTAPCISHGFKLGLRVYFLTVQRLARLPLHGEGET